MARIVTISSTLSTESNDWDEMEETKIDSNPTRAVNFTSPTNVVITDADLIESEKIVQEAIRQQMERQQKKCCFPETREWWSQRCSMTAFTIVSFTLSMIIMIVLIAVLDSNKSSDSNHMCQPSPRIEALSSYESWKTSCEANVIGTNFTGNYSINSTEYMINSSPVVNVSKNVNCSLEAYDAWLEYAWVTCIEQLSDNTCVSDTFLDQLPTVGAPNCGLNVTSTSSNNWTVFEEARQFDSAWCTSIDSSVTFDSIQEAAQYCVDARSYVCAGIVNTSGVNRTLLNFDPIVPEEVKNLSLSNVSSGDHIGLFATCWNQSLQFGVGAELVYRPLPDGWVCDTSETNVFIDNPQLGSSCLWLDDQNDITDGRASSEDNNDNNYGSTRRVHLIAMYATWRSTTRARSASSYTRVTGRTIGSTRSSGSKSSSRSSSGAAGGKATRGGGGGGGRACFPPGQRVTMARQDWSGNDGISYIVQNRKQNSHTSPMAPQYKPIELVVPGDMTADGAVISTLRLMSQRADPLYVYNKSAIVSGSHVVLDNHERRWMHVSESIAAVHHHVHHPILYNLVTMSHRITINGTVFADWEEVPMDKSRMASKQLLNHLEATLTPADTNIIPSSNLMNASQVPTRGFCVNGGFVVGSFTPGTLVERRDRTLIPIRDVRIGDEINGGTVVGIVSSLIQRHISDLYVYNETVIADGDAILYDRHDAKWRRLRDSPLAILRGPHVDSVVMNLITTSHKLGIAGTVWVDYEAVDSSLANEYQQNIATLNSKLKEDSIGTRL